MTEDDPRTWPQRHVGLLVGNRDDEDGEYSLDDDEDVEYLLKVGVVTRSYIRVATGWRAA